MKVFRIRPLSTAAGDFVFADIVQNQSKNWYEEAQSLLAAKAPFVMKWGDGSNKKKIADLIPSTAPGELFSCRATDVIKVLIHDAVFFEVVVQNGEGITGISPKNYTDENRQIDHLFDMYPRHSYPLVTEVFKQAWERHGFTGATFELVDEMADERFVAVVE